MGEYSKRVGEVGEKVVSDFLSLLGWENIQRNFDILSIAPEDHEKKTHGIDGYYHYRSPMVSNTIENVLMSSKYSAKPYPTNPVSDFKDHYTDLAIAIESFKKSEVRQQTLALHDDINTHFDRGILFWLNNSGQAENDLLPKLARIELPKEYRHDGIFLVDNRRIEFIYDSIMFARGNYPGYDLDFIYFNTGLNNDEINIRNGKTMPVQYINGSVLPLRLAKDNETIVMISSIENFDRAELMKLMGVAKNIGCNVQGKTIICFPNFLETEHAPVVSNIKQSFNDTSFTRNLIVANFNNSILK